MTTPYHPGELAVQARAGVLGAAARVGGIISPAIPASADAFLARQPFAVIGAADAAGHVWASLLSGAAGLLHAPDPQTLYIAARPAIGDPLADALSDSATRAGAADAGVLVIDLATRRRLRVNGTAVPSIDGGLLVRVRQSYWICPKYIQQRVLLAPPADAPASAAETTAGARAAGLTDAQRAWIARADTFFIGTVGPAGGADASHRGGEPGFVQLARGAAGEDVLEFPDYPGNNMFNTFGNLAVHPAAGLLFVDFARGTTLQLTGSAEVLWERAQYIAWPGAERAVRFRVDAVLERPHGTALRWRLVERSPFNPPARRARGRVA